MNEEVKTKEAKEGKKRRGFARMDPDEQRAIASRGGRAAHANGTAYKLAGEKAREAGQKGGFAVSVDREHMREIGRRGGMSAHRARRRKEASS